MRKSLILAAMLAAAPFAASAESMSYRYAEAGFSQLNINDDSLDDPKLNGGYIRGAFPIAEQVYLTGGVNTTSKDYDFYVYDGYYDEYYRVRLDTKVNQYELGIGYHMPFTDRLDFIAEASLVRLNTSIEATDVDEKLTQNVTRGRGTLGLRGTPSARTEAWARVGYIDGRRFDDWLLERNFGRGFTGNVGGQIKFNQTWGMVGEIETINDGLRYNLGVRASF